jgi:hypothetical protein
MIRTQVYLTDEQARDIKLRAKRENKHGAEVIRENDPEAAGVDISLLASVSPIEWTNVILYGEYRLNRNLVK